MPRWCQELEDAVSEGGFTALLLLRLTPLPIAMSSLLLGSANNVNAGKHLAATSVGFTRLAVNVYLGSIAKRALDEQDDPEHSSGLTRWLQIGGVIATILAIGNVARLLSSRRMKRSTKGR